MPTPRSAQEAPQGVQPGTTSVPSIDLEDGPDGPGVAQDEGARARSAKEWDEVVLPTGRAVRIRRLGTREYLAVKEAAATAVGDSPDPGGARYQLAMNREGLARALVAYTEPLDWAAAMEAQERARKAAAKAAWDAAQESLPRKDRKSFVFMYDVQALLAGVSADEWQRTTPQELLVGERSLEVVFNDVADWEVLVATVARSLLPKRDLSGIAGKVVRVAR